jgi:hypothetical protein
MYCEGHVTCSYLEQEKLSGDERFAIAGTDEGGVFLWDLRRGEKTFLLQNVPRYTHTNPPQDKKNTARPPTTTSDIGFVPPSYATLGLKQQHGNQRNHAAPVVYIYICIYIYVCV